MSGKFSGFSEDDIEKLKKTGSLNNEIKPRELKPPRKNLRKTIPVKAQSINLNSNMPEEIPEGARLSLPIKQNELSADVGNELTKILNSNNNNNSYQIIELNEKSQTMEEKSKTIEESHIDLSNFEEEQKRMEEENRRRKELLAKALADRTKKTNAEVQKLESIQKELQKLDSMLSNDVSILRNQIEEASIEFMQCQKRFERVEKDYTSTKLKLEQKRERKDLLTQHLCTIIQQNEKRKADKLSSLMKELELPPNEIDENNV
ncbi:RAB6-interacting golgin [Chrysoperla carnea]|uniref:RAB6-interacting golgin n=1 Tax=Chrysoperla carnea TaxID=189513 RepID=UPI001D07DDF8|nr:RAB6-interacting golgin [Chrysoperla carnea]